MSKNAIVVPSGDQVTNHSTLSGVCVTRVAIPGVPAKMTHRSPKSAEGGLGPACTSSSVPSGVHDGKPTWYAPSGPVDVKFIGFSIVIVPSVSLTSKTVIYG
jgi:hypothetical protein